MADVEDNTGMLEEPVEGVAPPAPDYKMEGPTDKFYTPPTSPTPDHEIDKIFDELCLKKQNDMEMVGEIWSQDQFTEEELLWTWALQDVPSPTNEEEKSLLAFDICLESE